MSEQSRNAEAALRPVAGVGEIQVVGALAETILQQVGILTSARSVWLHQDVVYHIHTQRGSQTGDAEFALQNLAAAILHPHYCGPDTRDKRGRRMDLVHLCEPDQRPLYVALKVVSAIEASSELDEIWVSTAHPLPRNFLTQRRYKGKLQPVMGSHH